LVTSPQVRSDCFITEFVGVGAGADDGDGGFRHIRLWLNFPASSIRFSIAIASSSGRET